MGLGQGQGEFPGGGPGQSPGGGTTLPTPTIPGSSVYWNGTMWVATPGPLVIAGDASGADPFSAPIQIPGLGGSPDIIVPAGSGNSQYNDDFDEDFGGGPPGWSTFGGSVSVDTSQVLSHLHLLNSSSGSSVEGIYKPVTLTFPATITAKVADASIVGANQYFFILISPVQPGNAGTGWAVGFAWGTGGVVNAQLLSINMATGATGSFTNGVQLYPPGYLRFVITGGGVTVQAKVAQAGLAYGNVGAAQTLSANAAFVMIGANGFGQTDNEMFVDWLRFQ